MTNLDCILDIITSCKFYIDFYNEGKLDFSFLVEDGDCPPWIVCPACDYEVFDITLGDDGLIHIKTRP